MTSGITMPVRSAVRIRRTTFSIRDSLVRICSIVLLAVSLPLGRNFGSLVTSRMHRNTRLEADRNLAPNASRMSGVRGANDVYAVGVRCHRRLGCAARASRWGSLNPHTGILGSRYHPHTVTLPICANHSLSDEMLTPALHSTFLMALYGLGICISV
jgi:hypothetical protein